jgi:hypothetical protein
MVSATNPRIQTAHWKPSEHIEDMASVLPDPLDLIETFGPMSGMHAAMAARGVGMPCGIVGRFQETNSEELEVAIEKAKQRLPILDRRVRWIKSRPVLVKANSSATKSATNNSLFDPDCTFWRYRILPYGKDVWLLAIWPHAMADGPSMLRFFENIAAITATHPVRRHRYQRTDVELEPMAMWLPRFLIDKSQRYLQPSDRRLPLGVAWWTVQREHWLPFVENGPTNRVSAAAWLGAAACIALCEQKCVTNGKILLNIQVQQRNLEHVGGFGFAAGSLLLPVKLSSKCSLPSLARSIFSRLSSMINRGWNDNFERLLGNNPRRHRWFAWLDARGLRGAMVSVSWKDYRWEIDGHNKISDVACFALSPTLHVSGHVDQAGISLSVTSKQLANERGYLLQRLVHLLSGDSPERILMCDGRDITSLPINARQRPSARDP